VGSSNLAYNLAGGTIFASSTPANIRALFTNSNPNLARDAYGIYRPNACRAGAGLGIHRNRNRACAAERCRHKLDEPSAAAQQDDGGGVSVQR
jgi:hypothetical protein